MVTVALVGSANPPPPAGAEPHAEGSITLEDKIVASVDGGQHGRCLPASETPSSPGEVIFPSQGRAVACGKAHTARAGTDFFDGDAQGFVALPDRSRAG